MNKTIMIGALLILAGAAYFALNKPTAFAATAQFGRGQGAGRQQMLTEKAKIFNMSPSALQNEINKGKTLYQIAQEKGISTDSLHEQMESFQKARFQALVDQGVMTKTEMQERLNFMEERQANCGKNLPLNGQSGRGMGMHR